MRVVVGLVLVLAVDVDELLHTGLLHLQVVVGLVVEGLVIAPVEEGNVVECEVSVALEGALDFHLLVLDTL